MRRLLGSVLLAASSLLLLAESAPTLRMPGQAARAVEPAALLGSDRSDVKVEDGKGGATVYGGLPLLAVLEKNGLDLKDMNAERKVAPAIVVATARDGYTVVFSVGELLLHRSDPKVYLVAEKSGAALPSNEGPVRLIVVGQRARSAYGLAQIELKYLADNPPAKH
ncbi:MAG TPA: hypothetical protein VF376_06110 [Thermoanaerobaculia bacterium]